MLFICTRSRRSGTVLQYDYSLMCVCVGVYVYKFWLAVCFGGRRKMAAEVRDILYIFKKRGVIITLDFYFE